MAELTNTTAATCGNPGCPCCRRAEAILVDLENAETELRVQRRANVALRNQNAAMREDEPEAEAIREVLDYWKARLKHPRAKTPLSGERAAKVRARLRDGFTVQRLKRAVDGCALMPYVGAGGRKPFGKPSERHDDLELICRNEVKVRQFEDIAERAPLPAVPGEKYPPDPLEITAEQYYSLEDEMVAAGFPPHPLGLIGQVRELLAQLPGAPSVGYEPRPGETVTQRRQRENRDRYDALFEETFGPVGDPASMQRALAGVREAAA